VKNGGITLSLIESEIQSDFERFFEETDSVLIFNMSKNCTITKYGYGKNDDESLIII
jgi:CRISPR-associated protein Cas2